MRPAESVARGVLVQRVMRALLIVIVSVAVVGGVLTHRNRGRSKEPEAQKAVAAAHSSAAREPSQHNWPKRTLDRAADVKRQVAEQRQEDATR